VNWACGACSAAVPDGITLCEDDAERMLDALYRVPTVVDDLRTTFTRQDQMRGPGAQVGKSTETPLPWNDRIPEKLDALTEVLCRWARPVARARNLDSLPVIPYTRDPHDPARVPGSVSTAILAARVLSDHWSTVRTLVDAGDAYAEVIDAVHQAERVVDRPVDRLYLGQCGAEGEDGGRCDYDLYVRPKRATVSCPRCATEWDVEQRREVLKAAMVEHLEWSTGTAAEVAGWLRLAGVNVGTSTVRRWGAEERMTVVGRSVRGHALYRVGEVRQLFEQKEKGVKKPKVA
jgi:hypothetical protein